MGADVSALLPLVEKHPFVPKRAFRHAGYDVMPQFIAEQMQILSRAESTVVIESGGAPAAAVGYAPREFETEVLGVRSVGVSEIFTRADLDRRELVTEALTLLRERLRVEGGGMLVLRVDTLDGAALAGAQAAGFTVCDTSTFWVITPGPREQIDEVGGYRVAILDPDESARLPYASVEALIAEAGRAFGTSHFHNDPRIEPGRADELYRRWAHNTVYGGWYDRLITVRDAEHLVGVLGWKIMTMETDQGPIRVMADSFGWRLPSAPGAGKAFHRCVVSGFDVDVIEGATQISNPLVYVLARGGNFKAILSRYVMHGWAD